MPTDGSGQAVTRRELARQVAELQEESIILSARLAERPVAASRTSKFPRCWPTVFIDTPKLIKENDFCKLITRILDSPDPSVPVKLQSCRSCVDGLPGFDSCL